MSPGDRRGVGEPGGSGELQVRIPLPASPAGLWAAGAGDVGLSAVALIGTAMGSSVQSWSSSICLLGECV